MKRIAILVEGNDIEFCPELDVEAEEAEGGFRLTFASYDELKDFIAAAIQYHQTEGADMTCPECAVAEFRGELDGIQGVDDLLGAMQDRSDAPSEAVRPVTVDFERRAVVRATELECTKYVGADGYYALAVKDLDQEQATEFLIGKEGYAALEFCFGVTEQPGALSEGEYAELCLSDYAELLDMRLDELDD